MIAIYAVIATPFGWMFISKLQRNVAVFTTLSNYFVYKTIISLFIGWAIAPFYMVYFVFKIIRWIFKRNKTRDQTSA